MANDIALEARQLTKHYGSFKAVDDLSFKVCQGEVLGFLGPNGAGKTTSINLICGLLKADSGEVIFHSVNGSAIGVCPQTIVVWENLTCLEQLTFMGEMYGLRTSSAKKRGLYLLEVLGLLEKKDKLAKTLSGGMQRRLNIALAFIHEPPFVILDEPQAGLDPQSRVLVREFISSVKKSTTVILTTHDMEEAEKLSDTVCIIDHGKVLISGTVEEIKKQTGQGDTLEIEIAGDVSTELLPLVTDTMGKVSQLSSGKVSLSTQLGTHWVPSLLSSLAQHRVAVKEFRLRQSSLEDVFIALTGRGLRE